MGGISHSTCPLALTDGSKGWGTTDCAAGRQPGPTVGDYKVKFPGAM